MAMGKYRNLKTLAVTFLFLLISILTVSHEAYPRNWDWDQNHDCVQGIPGKSGWCKWGYDGNPADCDAISIECCELLCKICPVYAYSGRYQKTFTDLTVPGVGPTLAITRTYNSQEWSSSLLGYSWTFNFGRKLIVTRNMHGEKIIGVLLKTGEKNYYREETDGALTRLTDYGATYELVKNGDNTYTIVNRDSTRYELRQDGKTDKVIDKNNNELVFTYNTVGCLSRITNASGNYVDFQLGPNGKIASVSDNLGRTIGYTYDQNGNLISVTDPLGNKTQYVYNSDNFLTQIIDTRGNVVETAGYDNHEPPRVSTFTEKGETYTIAYFDGRTEKTDSQGNKWTYYFNDVGVIEKVVDPLGNETNRQLNKVTAQSVDWEDDLNGNRTSYTYNGDGNIATKTDPLGNTWTYTYIAGTNLLETETDPLGVVTKHEYDANGNRTKIIMDFGGALENTTTYTYDSQGNLTTTTDPIGNTTSYGYDANGNLLTVTDPLDNVTSYTYDNRGNKLTETDANGNTTTYTYDLMDRLVSVTDALGNSVSYTYDANGNLASTQHPDGSTTTFAYGAYNRLIQETDPLGNSRTYTYDKNDNILTITDANGNTTTYIYDPLDRKARVIGAEGNQINFAYDANGNLTSVTDANGNTTAFIYDALNRVVQKTYDDGTNYIYGYDAVGNKSSERDANGNTTTFTYDHLSRLVTKTYQDGSTSNYTYDALGRMITGTNADGNLAFAYDVLGRVTQAVSNGKTISYSYDSVGNLIAMITPEGTEVQYTYNNVNAMTRLGLPNDKAIDYIFDSLMRLARKTFPGGSYTIYHHDTVDRLTQIRDMKSDGSQIYSEDNTFDNEGNIIAKTTGLGASIYDYDRLYQLTSASHPTEAQESFTYDSVGNRLTSASFDDWAYNNRNQLRGYAGVTFTYDANGNTITKTDVSGTTRYTYDFENRLIRIDSPDGNWTTYKYDIFGRRIAKNVDGVVIEYVYDDEFLLAEYDSSGSLLRNYYQSPSSDYDPTVVAVGNDLYFFHCDHISVPQRITDENGDFVWEGYHNGFGDVTVTQEALVNNLRFPGQYFDQESRLHYNFYRYYDPESGRYLSPDPLWYSGGGVNLYTYTNNNPTNYVDYFGMVCGVIVKRDKVAKQRGQKNVGHEWIEYPGGSMGFYPTGSIWRSKGIVYRPDRHGGKPGDKRWSTNLLQKGKLKYGSGKGNICKCATCSEVTSCLNAVADEWNKKYYMLLFRNCRHFVAAATDSCCLDDKH